MGPYFGCFGSSLGPYFTKEWVLFGSLSQSLGVFISFRGSGNDDDDGNYGDGNDDDGNDDDGNYGDGNDDDGNDDDGYDGD